MKSLGGNEALAAHEAQWEIMYREYGQSRAYTKNSSKAKKTSATHAMMKDLDDEDDDDDDFDYVEAAMEKHIKTLKKKQLVAEWKSQIFKRAQRKLPSNRNLRKTAGKSVDEISDEAVTDALSKLRRKEPGKIRAYRRRMENFKSSRGRRESCRQIETCERSLQICG